MAQVAQMRWGRLNWQLSTGKWLSKLLSVLEKEIMIQKHDNMANLFEQGKQKLACSLNNVWLFWEYSGLTLKAVASGSTKWAENKEIKIHTFPHIQAEQGKIEGINTEFCLFTRLWMKVTVAVSHNMGRELFFKEVRQSLLRTRREALVWDNVPQRMCQTFRVFVPHLCPT